MAVRDSTRDRAIVQPAARHTTLGSGAPSCFGLQPDRSSVQDPVSLSSRRPIFLSAERLVQIWSNNEREIMELRVLRLKAARARAYLLSPGCNRLLGRACLKRLETHAPGASSPAAWQPPSGPRIDGRTGRGPGASGRYQASLVFGSSRRLAQLQFGAASHAMLVRVAI